MAKKEEEKKPAAGRPARGAAKEETKTQEETPEISELHQKFIDAAENLNSVLGLEPAIDVTLGEEELATAISAEAKLIGVDTKTNKVTDAVIAADKKALKSETWELMMEMNWLGHIAPAKEEKKGAAKAKDKPAAAAKDTTKTKPAASKSAGEKKTKTRTACFCAALMEEAKKKAGVTVAQLAKYTDEDFVKAGGKSNLKQTEYMIKVHLPVLIDCDVISIDAKGNITLK